MRGDDRVIEFLNEQLTAELTAINQYFLHGKMQENFGWVKIAKHTRAEAMDEMRHAEVLTDRILFLDGLPNYQRLFALRIAVLAQLCGNVIVGLELIAAERERQRVILETALDAVVSIDADARVTYVNSAFERTCTFFAPRHCMVSIACAQRCRTLTPASRSQMRSMAAPSIGSTSA